MPSKVPAPARISLGEVWERVVSLARYLTQTEVHTYAFSVAANAILSLFPFIVMMYTVARKVFHSQSMEDVIGSMVRYFLPTGQEFVVKNMSLVANAHSGVRVAAVIMLLISSSGIFLPARGRSQPGLGGDEEPFLPDEPGDFNRVGADRLRAGAGVGRGYRFSAHAADLDILSGTWTVRSFTVVAEWLLQVTAGFLSVMLFFLIYWILPNRRLPWRAVLPSALVTGLLWELAKLLYMAALPWLDFRGVYGPFATSVGLMLWAFLTGSAAACRRTLFGDGLHAQAGASGRS